MPYVCDLLEHTFNEYEHIAVVHHGKGKNHVHLDVNDIAKNDNASSTGGLRSSDEVSVHIPAENFFIVSKEQIVDNPYWVPLISHLPVVYSPVHIRPPRA